MKLGDQTHHNRQGHPSKASTPCLKILYNTPCNNKIKNSIEKLTWEDKTHKIDDRN